MKQTLRMIIRMTTTASLLWYGAAFAQPAADNVTHSAGIIYFSAPYTAQDYKVCIFGTGENARLSDDQQIGCEDRYNPDDENLSRPLPPPLANLIKQHWGETDFFAVPSNYIYQLEESVTNRSVYLWPDGPGWMTPAGDDRYVLRPFALMLSTVNRTTGDIRSLPVLLYQHNGSQGAQFADYIYDFDLTPAPDNRLTVTIYRYQNKKRMRAEQYTITPSGQLIPAGR